ncbi:HlyD family type I secretion periplasmic adaptor subunit [Sphingobium mellinum]|uniref:HlyD family type I secretion periplasmic adaptor subunit n=1 Tax=Sphingobium mellinum TaxID=1387166 RepID=UPI0030EF0044
MNLPLRRDDPNQQLALFLSEASEQEAQSAFGLQRLMYVLAGLFAALMLAAAIIPIGSAVIGSGQVGAESRVKRIAHPTGGVITEILVSNGQHVARGQLLIRLDNKVTGADATYSNLTVEQLLAQRARLEAEQLGSGKLRFPPELTQANTASARQAMADEQRLYTIKASEEAGLRAQLAARQTQYSQEIAGFQAQIIALQRQRTLIEPERRGVKDLWSQQLVTINRMNELERTAASIDGNIASLNAQIAQSRAKISETREQAIQLGDTRRSQAGVELNQVNTALNQQRVRSVAASDQQTRSEIRAPYDGIVEKIAFAAVGDVIKPAEPIMEIVPDRDQMIVEAALSPMDIDRVRSGQKARIRFSSFNRAATPEIPGRVTYVASDKSVDPEGKSAFYTARITVDPAALNAAGLQLRGGMPAEVYIETGNRSMLSYITKPLRDQFARSFRDK